MIAVTVLYVDPSTSSLLLFPPMMDFLVYPTVICFPHAVLQQNALTVRHGDWNLSMVPHHTRAALGALELPWLSTALGKLNSTWVWEPGPAGLGSCCPQGRCCGVGCARPQLILMGSLPSTADPWPPGMHRAEGLLPPELWQRICKGQSISVHQALEIPLGPPQQGRKC